MQLQRIHIIGGPGSGKSYLARALGERLALPVHELDRVAFAGPQFLLRPRPARLDDVQAIANGPFWISEGIFLGWIEELLVRAELIIWLDCVHWPHACARLALRFAHGGVAEIARQHGPRKFNLLHDYQRNLRLLAAVLLSSHRYYYDQRTAACLDPPESRYLTAQRLLPYRHKVAYCPSSRQVERILTGLTGAGWPAARRTHHSRSTTTEASQ